MHVVILVGAFLGMNGGELPTLWLLLWIVIFGAAWITTWQPEPEILV
jgi:hypothetical protein